MSDVICEKADGCYIPATDCGHGKRHSHHACKMLIHGCSMLKCIPVEPEPKPGPLMICEHAVECTPGVLPVRVPCIPHTRTSCCGTSIIGAYCTHRRQTIHCIPFGYSGEQPDPEPTVAELMREIQSDSHMVTRMVVHPLPPDGLFCIYLDIVDDDGEALPSLYARGDFVPALRRIVARLQDCCPTCGKPR